MPFSKTNAWRESSSPNVQQYCYLCFAGCKRFFVVWKWRRPKFYKTFVFFMRFLQSRCFFMRFLHLIAMLVRSFITQRFAKQPSAMFYRSVSRPSRLLYAPIVIVYSCFYGHKETLLTFTWAPAGIQWWSCRAKGCINVGTLCMSSVLLKPFLCYTVNKIYVPVLSITTGSCWVLFSVCMTATVYVLAIYFDKASSADWSTRTSERSVGVHGI